MKCAECGEQLEESLFSVDKQWKSCPGCSVREGRHIYYPYPQYFGKSQKRVTPTNPDGAQSHCRKCRGHHVIVRCCHS